MLRLAGLGGVQVFARATAEWVGQVQTEQGCMRLVWPGLWQHIQLRLGPPCRVHLLLQYVLRSVLLSLILWLC